MSIAKKCDRCGKLFEGILMLPPSELLNSDWWRYSITRDNHPYSEEKIDLCVNCNKSLYEWLKREDKS